MKLPSIQIQTKPLKLGMNTQNANFKVDKWNPSSLKLQTNPSKLEMHSEQVKVLIDQTQCFEEAGLKSNGSLIADNASLGMQKSMETIGKIVDQGNQLAAIETGSDPIPDQSIYNAYEQFYRQWNLGFIPTSRPDFKVTGGTVDINFKPAEIINNTQKQSPSFEYTRGKVNIYVDQYNSIEMSVIDLKG